MKTGVFSKSYIGLRRLGSVQKVKQGVGERLIHGEIILVIFMPRTYLPSLPHSPEHSRDSGYSAA